MKSPFELELQIEWRRQRLLAEAESERLARQLRTPRRSTVRARVAAALHALADWLSPDACGLVDKASLHGLETA